MPTIWPWGGFGWLRPYGFFGGLCQRVSKVRTDTGPTGFWKMNDVGRAFFPANKRIPESNGSRGGGGGYSGFGSPRCCAIRAESVAAVNHRSPDFATA